MLPAEERAAPGHLGVPAAPVATPPRPLAHIDRFLRTGAQLRRRAGDRSLYRQRTDLVASLRRNPDFAGAIKLDGLRTVDVLVTWATTSALCASRPAATSRAIAAAGGGRGLGGRSPPGAGAVLAEPVLVIGALPAGAVVGGVAWVAAGAGSGGDDVGQVLAALLDRL